MSFRAIYSRSSIIGLAWLLVPLLAPAQDTPDLVASSHPTGACATSYGVFFTADDGIHGRELWFSPTVGNAGTRLVMDINPGPAGSDPLGLVDFGDRAIFSAYTPGNGRELWFAAVHNDAASAQIITDIEPGIFSSDPSGMTVADGFVIFYATTVREGREPWALYPNLQHSLLKDINAGNASSGIQRPSALSIENRAIFVATTMDNGLTYWTTDGTPAGTTMIANVDDAAPAPARYKQGYVCALEAPGLGRELFLSPDALSPPQLLKDIRPGEAAGEISDLCAWNDQFLFRASDGVHGAELWISDGTAEGTRMLIDINPGEGSSMVSNFAPTGDYFFFSAEDGTHGREIWATRGTAETTHLIRDIMPGPQGCDPYGQVVCNVTGSRKGAAEIERALAAGTIKDEMVVFTANDGEHGEELWLTGGTPESTSFVADIFPGSESAFPHDKIRIAQDSGVFFAARSPSAGREPWIYFPALDPPSMIEDINKVPSRNPSSSPRELTDAAPGVFMAAYDNDHGEELWCIRGPGDAVLVADIWPGATSSSIRCITAAGRGVFFCADDGNHGAELWFSDGTAAGTRLISDLDPGAVASTPANLYYSGDCLYFSASTPEQGCEPYRLCEDGVPALLADIAPGSASSQPEQFVRHKDMVYFIADDGVRGREPWAVDRAGTVRLVADLAATEASAVPHALHAADFGLLLQVSDNAHGTEPWQIIPGEGAPVIVRDIRQ